MQIHNDEEFLPSKQELIDQIDTNLRHLQGQKKILQNAKDGKTWKQMFSFNEKNKNIKASIRKCNLRCNISCEHFCRAIRQIAENKRVKVANSYTQIGSSLHQLNSKRNGKGSTTDLNKCTTGNTNFRSNVHLDSPARKVNSKTLTNVSKRYSKRLLSYKDKDSSSENCQPSPMLESEACEKFNFQTKLERNLKSHEISYESHTFKNKNNNLWIGNKVKSIYTQTSKKLPTTTAELSSTIDISLSPSSQKKSGRTLHQTASLIRHVKLSNQRRDHKSLEEKNEEKGYKKKHPTKELLSHKPLPNGEPTPGSETSKAYQKFNHSKKRTDVKQNVSIYNHDTFIIVNSNGQKSQKTGKCRENDNEMCRSKKNNLTETSYSTKSHNVNVKKPNIIDDSTYVCPDNGEEKDYLLIHYAPKISEENVNLNLYPKSEREHKSNRVGLSEPIVTPTQKPSKPSPSLDNEIVWPSYKPYQEPENTLDTNINREKNSSQRSDKSEHMSHNLETTWKSHTNREGRHSCSKFVTSHNNRIKIPTDYNLKNRQVQTFSKRSSQKKIEMNSLSSSLNSSYDHKTLFHNYKPTKLASSQIEQANLREIDLTDLGAFRQYGSGNNITNNQAFAIQPDKINLKDYLLDNNLERTSDPENIDLMHTLSQQNEKQSELTELEFEHCSFLAVPSSIKDVCQQGTKDEILTKGNVETIANLIESSSVVSWTPQEKLAYSDNELQEQVFNQRRPSSTQNYGSKLKSFSLQSVAVPKKNIFQDRLRLSELKHQLSLPVNENQLILKPSKMSQKFKLPTTQSASPSGAILRMRENENDLAHKSLPAQEKWYVNQDLSRKIPWSETQINVAKGDTHLQFEPEPISQKNELQVNQCVPQIFGSNRILNHSKLSAIPNMCSNETHLNLKSIRKINSFSLADPQPKEYETQNISRRVQNQNASTGSISVTYKSNQTVNLNSGLSHDDEVEISASSLSGLKCGANPKTIAKGKSKLESSFFMSSPSQSSQWNSYESQNSYQKSPGRMSLKHKSEQESQTNTQKAHQSDEKKTGWNHIDDKEVSKSLQSTLNDKELGAIPKFRANENDPDLKYLKNKSSLSLSTINPESDNSTGRTSLKLETLSQNNSLKTHHSGSILLDPYTMKESDRVSISNDIEEPPSSASYRNIFSQQPFQNNKKSSASQYLKLFWNGNDKVKKNFRTSLSKFKPNLDSSRLSKSLQDLNNNEPVEILRTTSLTVSNTDKRKTSDVSSRTKISLRAGTENKKSINKKVGEVNEFNILNKTKFDSNMPPSIPRPKEKSPPVKLKSKLSINQTEINLDQDCGQNCSLSSGNSRLNETRGNVKSEKKVFLSDTFNQITHIEGVSQEVEDLIQHLHNRVMDCDENVKNQSKEFEKLKKSFKIVEPSTSNDVDRRKVEKMIEKSSNETGAEVKLENIANNELAKPLIKENIGTSKNDLREENSCHCIFCVHELSISVSSEEIPSFNGCDCMKEDYYKIMRIAYNK